MRLRIWLLVGLATLVTSIFLSQNAFAARVSQVKGNKVLIELEGDSANVGDKFFVMISGKKRAVVTITKVSKAKALATVDKGKAQVNGTLQLAKAASGGSSGSGSSESSHASHGKGGKSWGVLGGYSMDSQTAGLTDPTHTQKENVSMSGSGFAVLGFVDMPFSGALHFQGRGGIEMFNVSGTAQNAWCSGSSTQCETKITYLTLDALMKYDFGGPDSTFVPWGALGLGIFYPISKSTTALSPDIGMSTVALLNLGIKYNLAGGSYILAYGEYGYFPSSPDVSTHIMGVKAGYGMAF